MTSVPLPGRPAPRRRPTALLRARPEAVTGARLSSPQLLRRQLTSQRPTHERRHGRSVAADPAPAGAGGREPAPRAGRSADSTLLIVHRSSLRYPPLSAGCDTQYRPCPETCQPPTRNAWRECTTYPRQTVDGTGPYEPSRSTPGGRHDGSQAPGDCRYTSPSPIARTRRRGSHCASFTRVTREGRQA